MHASWSRLYNRIPGLWSRLYTLVPFLAIYHQTLCKSGRSVRPEICIGSERLNYLILKTPPSRDLERRTCNAGWLGRGTVQQSEELVIQNSLMLPLLSGPLLRKDPVVRVHDDHCSHPRSTIALTRIPSLWHHHERGECCDSIGDRVVQETA